MSLKIRFTPQADHAITEALDWYQAEAPEQIDRFLARLDDVVERISRFPVSAPQLRPPLRRAGISNFPFGLWYEAKTFEIVIIDVIHTRRDLDTAL